MTKGDRPVVWCDASLELGECPRWTGDRLVLVDLEAGRLLEATHGTLRPLVELDVALGAVAPVAGADDTWIAAAGTGLALIGSDGIRTWLDRPLDRRGVACRMNDAVCDPAGRFWAGSKAWDDTPKAAELYRVDHDGTVTLAWDGLTIANGPAFSPDGTRMYLADTPEHVIHAFPVSESGDLGEPDTFALLDGAFPDGMTTDVDGNLWVALWGGGEVRQYAPDGGLRAVVPLPVPQPTAPCLGGTDGRRLFITTAAYGLEEPGASGSVYALDVSTPGRPAQPFGPITRA